LASKYDAQLLLVLVANYPRQYLGLTGHDVAVGLPLSSQDVENMKKKAKDSIERIGAIATDHHLSAKKEILDTSSSIVDSIAHYAEKELVQIAVVGIRGLCNFDP
jgi:hypothetical protein